MVTTEQKNNRLKNLLSLALAGDKNSYQEFLLQISSIVRVIVAKKITAADVEDVVQEILISVHKSRHTYDLDRPLMPWLMTIANFRIIDYLRKHYAEMRHKISDIDEFVDILTDVTNETSGNELVFEILATLDSKNQKILKMLYVDGHSIREVAQELKMNESAIKVAAHRAIKKIKQKFPKA
jgi:RNA polymerase sigma-70 factor (ECF subfamily)